MSRCRVFSVVSGFDSHRRKTLVDVSGFRRVGEAQTAKLEASPESMPPSLLEACYFYCPVFAFIGFTHVAFLVIVSLLRKPTQAVNSLANVKQTDGQCISLAEMNHSSSSHTRLPSSFGNHRGVGSTLGGISSIYQLIVQGHMFQPYPPCSIQFSSARSWASCGGLGR